MDHRAAMTCTFDLDHYAEILAAAADGGYRWTTFAEPPAPRQRLPPPRRRPVARRGAADGRARGGRGRPGHVLPDDALGVLQPRLGGGRPGDRAAQGARARGRAPRDLPGRATRRALRPGRRLAQPRPGDDDGADRGSRQRHAVAVVRPRRLPLGLEPALALGLPSRRPQARSPPLAAAARPPRDLGLSGRADGRDDACDAGGRAGSIASSSSPQTGSTCPSRPRHRTNVLRFRP